MVKVNDHFYFVARKVTVLNILNAYYRVIDIKMVNPNPAASTIRSIVSASV